MRRILGALVSVLAISCSGGGGSSNSGNTNPTPSAPSIALTASGVNFTTIERAASPAAQTITITNSGTGTLSGIATGTIVYGASQATGWITASLNTSTAPATLTLTPTTGTLAVGTYSASIPITSTVSGITNSPQTVSASMTVNPSSSGTATAVSLGVGQSQSFLTSPNFLAALAVQPGSQYLIEVVNTDATYTQTESFQFTGAFASSVAAASRAAVARPPFVLEPAPAARVAVDRQALEQLSTLRSTAQTHVDALEHSRQVYARFGNPLNSRTRLNSIAQAAQIAPAIVQTIGTVNKVYVANSLNGGCSSVDSIGARTVAVGQHVIVLADTNLTKWPLSQRPDTSFYASFASEYDTITWPHLLTYIGNPLIDDVNLSGIGKVTIVLTPTLNNLKGGRGGGIAVAFVNDCDFYPNHSVQTGNGFSNFTETIYSLVPSATTFSVSVWEAQLRATVAHESKHVVSFADRILNSSASLEETWLEEGLAQVSSEIWMRHFNQATWLGHATFAQTGGCEIFLGPTAACNGSNTNPIALMVSHLPFLFEYLQSEGTSNNEGLNADTPADYGAGWAMGRYVVDQYASGDEGAFIQSLINEPSRTGLTNVSFHTGTSIPTLLVNWNFAMAAYVTPSVAALDALNTVPSFDFAEIFHSGQTGYRSSTGAPVGFFSTDGTQNPPYPLSPIAVTTSAAFTRFGVGIPGTSAAYMVLTANAAGTETLQLQSPGGVSFTASSGFRVAIIRVK